MPRPFANLSPIPEQAARGSTPVPEQAARGLSKDRRADHNGRVTPTTPGS